MASCVGHNYVCGPMCVKPAFAIAGSIKTSCSVSASPLRSNFNVLGGTMDVPELKGYLIEKHFWEQSGHGNVSLKYFTMLLREVKGRSQKGKSGGLVILLVNVLLIDCLQPCCCNGLLCVLSIISCGLWFLSWYV